MGAVVRCRPSDSTEHPRVLVNVQLPTFATPPRSHDHGLSDYGRKVRGGRSALRPMVEPDDAAESPSSRPPGISPVSEPGSPQVDDPTLVALPRDWTGMLPKSRGKEAGMRTGVVAKRCSCGSFWRNGAHSCRRCGSTRFASWGFYVDTHPKGATESRKTVRSGFPTKDAAERELLRVLEAVQAGAYGAPSKQTLQGYLGAWLEAKTHLRPTTRDTYSILIERYICAGDYGIGTAPLWSLTRPGIKHFYAELERRGRMRGDRPLHPKAVHNVHLVLRKALEDAVDDGLILENPARRAHKLSFHRPEMKTWTEDQVASFLAHVRGHRLYALW